MCRGKSVLGGSDFRSQKYMVKPRGEPSRLGRSRHTTVFDFHDSFVPLRRDFGQRRPGKQPPAPQSCTGSSAQGWPIPRRLADHLPPLGVFLSEASLLWLKLRTCFPHPSLSGRAGVCSPVLGQQCCLCYSEAPANQEKGTTHTTPGLRHPDGILSASLSPAGCKRF